MEGLNSGQARALSFIVSVTAVAGALSALILSLRVWRATGREAARQSAARRQVSMGDAREGRTHFMAFAGVLLAGVFLLAAIFSGLPLAMIVGCG
jgi:hypothetical protein